MGRIQLALAAALCVFTVCAADAAQKQEGNKKIVMEFYEKAINRKDFEAASRYLDPQYIQHNQKAADGPEGLKDFYPVFAGKISPTHTARSNGCSLTAIT